MDTKHGNSYVASLSHVQRRLDDIIKDDPTIQFIDGEVFTTDYMDGVAEEINQILQEAGAGVSELCFKSIFILEYTIQRILIYIYVYRLAASGGASVSIQRVYAVSD